MKRTSRTFLLAALCAAGHSQAQDNPNAFTGKAALYSEYEYRGISQTSEKPAGQLNLDYVHSSGLYLGTFLSNIQWLKDTAEANGFSTSANLEWDIYGGYKFEVVKDWTLDLGYLRYEYPGSGEFNPKPNTDEVYAGVSYGPATLKYSYSFNDTFGVPDSKGSDYIELSSTTRSSTSSRSTASSATSDTKGRRPAASTMATCLTPCGSSARPTTSAAAGTPARTTRAPTPTSGLYTVKGKDWSKDRLVAFVTYSF